MPEEPKQKLMRRQMYQFMKIERRKRSFTDRLLRADVLAQYVKPYKSTLWETLRLLISKIMQRF